MYTQSIKRKERKNRKEKKKRKVCSIRSEQTTCRDTLQESLSFFEVTGDILCRSGQVTVHGSIRGNESWRKGG